MKTRSRRFALAIALLAAPLAAVDLVVTRYDDPAPDGCLAGDCSLREAVIEADADPAPDRILLSAGQYDLTRFGTDNASLAGDLDTNSEIEIVGPGATMTRIDASGLGLSADNGAIEVHAGSHLTLRGSTLLGAALSGFRVAGGDLTVEECEIRGSSSSFRSGIDAGGGGTITVRNSTIVDNVYGLTATGVAVVLENVTLDGNALFQLAALDTISFVCTHCTIVGAAGGDPELRADGAVIELGNSIVSGACLLLNGGLIVSLGGNVESPGHGCDLSAGDLDDVADLGLSALADHGGPTRTFDLDVDSPAIDLVLGADCLSRDQRGAARHKLATIPCDAGALERAAGPPTPIFADGFEQGDDGAWVVPAGT
ncbi:MAG TPA: right-handed parallel beta-helix repeat-containing protein [Thermoanaerobaculia bacterium]|nr:right-handed parallel beta-helix repeat-containing protein [Thermoanaerobaculia bacterium]